MKEKKADIAIDTTFIVAIVLALLVLVVGVAYGLWTGNIQSLIRQALNIMRFGN